jgi:uncharacterized protein (DUF362 family)
VTPLGRFAEVGALVTAFAIAGSWLVVQLGVIAAPPDTTALDIAAGTAIGILLGQRQTTNSAGKVAVAAHHRLDAIHAPAADNTAPPA